MGKYFDPDENRDEVERALLIISTLEEHESYLATSARPFQELKLTATWNSILTGIRNIYGELRRRRLPTDR